MLHALCFMIIITMLSFLIKIKGIGLDILFPSLCLNCGKTLIHADEKADEHGYAKFLCADCYALIKLNIALFCPVCRARLPDQRKICHRDSPYLLAAASSYDNPVIQNLIRYFKYKSFRNLAPFLGKITAQYIENCKLKIENFIVIPIPLHPSRERKRGFNQAHLLAEFTAGHFKLQLINGLKRIANNKPQVGLKDNETRVKNVLNCFEIKNPELVRGKNIILVDDVFTSGATMNEAVRVLKTAGAKRIIALTLAQA